MSNSNSHQHQKQTFQTSLQILEKFLAHIPALFGLSEFFRLSLQNEYSSALISLMLGCLGSLIFHLYLEIKDKIPKFIKRFL